MPCEQSEEHYGTTSPVATQSPTGTGQQQTEAPDTSAESGNGQSSEESTESGNEQSSEESGEQSQEVEQSNVESPSGEASVTETPVECPESSFKTVRKNTTFMPTRL